MRWTETGSSVPVFRIRLAPGGRVLAEAGTRPVLLGHIERGWVGGSLLWVQPDRGVEVLPPWTAGECRRLGADTVRWQHEIRRRLRESPNSPLHQGEWAISSYPTPWRSEESFLRDRRRWLRTHLVEPRPDDDRPGAITAQLDFYSQVPGTASFVIPLRRLGASGGSPNSGIPATVARGGACPDRSPVGIGPVRSRDPRRARPAGCCSVRGRRAGIRLLDKGCRRK